MQHIQTQLRAYTDSRTAPRGGAHARAGSNNVRKAEARRACRSEFDVSGSAGRSLVNGLSSRRSCKRRAHRDSQVVYCDCKRQRRTVRKAQCKRGRGEVVLEHSKHAGLASKVCRDEAAEGEGASATSALAARAVVLRAATPSRVMLLAGCASLCSRAPHVLRMLGRDACSCLPQANFRLALLVKVCCIETLHE